MTQTTLDNPVAPPSSRWDEYFQTKHLQKDLKAKTLRSGVLTLLTQVVRFSCQTLSTLVLARLLTPEDFGLVAMATVVTGLFMVIKDVGLNQATIQRPDITHGQVTNLFWINVGIGVAMGMFLIASGPVLAWIYGQPKVTPIMLALGAVACIGGLSVQHQSLMRRRMEFRSLMARDLSAQIIGVVASIAAAYYGLGYWALVINIAVFEIVNCSAVWLACPWRPGWYNRMVPVKEMLFYGGNLSLGNIVIYFGRNTDKALIGMFFGPTDLGMYSRAWMLLILPLQQMTHPINQVVNPALSVLADQEERYRAAFLRVLSQVALATCLAVCIMMAGSDWLVRITLGPKWMDTSEIFSILGAFGFVESTTAVASLLFMTRGNQSNLYMKWNVISVPIIIIGLLLGVPWGVKGVALSYVLTGIFIRCPLMYWYCGKHTPVKMGDFYRTVGPPILCAVATWLSILGLRHFIPPIDELLNTTHPEQEVSLIGACVGMAAICVLATALYGTLMGLLPSGRLALKDTLHMVQILRTRGKPKPQPAA